MENTEVVIYRSGDGSVSVEALVDSSNETIWATQKVIAELFGINLSGISRHISNIYETGELDRDTTLAKIATPVQSGFRGTISKEIDYYNLDVIIAVGYRVNSLKDKFGENQLFGIEKDKSFHSSIGQIYQTWDGKELYPSVEEKAATWMKWIS